MVRALVVLNATCYSAVGFKSTILSLCSFAPRILASKIHYFYFPVIHYYFTGTI